MIGLKRSFKFMTVIVSIGLLKELSRIGYMYILAAKLFGPKLV